MRLSVGLSAYLNNFSQPLAADVGLHGFLKRLYGKLVPFYRLRLGGECAASNIGLTLVGPEVPVVRAQAAIQRIEHTFAADAADGEGFTDWVCRKELPFFTELLDDFIQVSPSDLPELLADFDGKRDFQFITQASLPQQLNDQNQVAALLNEAKSEQAFRNSMSQKKEWEQARVCNENLLDLAAKAAIQVRGGILMIEGALHQPMERALPERLDLAHQYTALRQRLQVQNLGEEARLQLDGEVDSWLQRIILLCEQQEKIDQEVYDLSLEAAPLAFLKLKQSLQKYDDMPMKMFKLANNEAADIIISGLKTMGVELVSRQEAAQNSGGVLLVVKKSSESAKASLIH